MCEESDVKIEVKAKMEVKTRKPRVPKEPKEPKPVKIPAKRGRKPKPKPAPGYSAVVTHTPTTIDWS